jgi:hypothetical protein
MTQEGMHEYQLYLYMYADVLIVSLVRFAYQFLDVQIEDIVCVRRLN